MPGELTHTFEDKNISTFFIAGLDGYSESSCNYGYENKPLSGSPSYPNFEMINTGIQKFLLEFTQQHSICFLTNSIFGN